MAAKTIKVRASEQAQAAKTVVLYERHPDHPDGEIFISGNDTVHTVAPTAAVRQKLHDGLLVEVAAATKTKEPTKE